MDKFITFQTSLSTEQCKEKILNEKSGFLSQGMKVKLNFPKFKVFKTFSINPLDYFDVTRTLIFSGTLKKAGSGTIIKGYFRYNYLFTYFWAFVFIVATFFMYKNSGQEYPLAPFIVFLIGCCFVGSLLFIAPRNFSRIYHKSNYFWPRNMVNELSAILEVKS